VSQDLDTQHFADPSEPGAPGHQQWLRDQRGKWSVKDTLTGEVYRMPNKLIAESVAEMHGHAQAIPGWPEDSELQDLRAELRAALALRVGIYYSAEELDHVVSVVFEVLKPGRCDYAVQGVGRCVQKRGHGGIGHLVGDEPLPKDPEPWVVHSIDSGDVRFREAKDCWAGCRANFEPREGFSARREDYPE
jgi:hypothetical protein